MKATKTQRDIIEMAIRYRGVDESQLTGSQKRVARMMAETRLINEQFTGCGIRYATNVNSLKAVGKWQEEAA
jgi:hypothetical protein